MSIGGRYRRAVSRRIVRKPGAGKLIDSGSQFGASILRFAYVKVPYRAYRGGRR